MYWYCHSLLAIDYKRNWDLLGCKSPIFLGKSVIMDSALEAFYKLSSVLNLVALLSNKKCWSKCGISSPSNYIILLGSTLSLEAQDETSQLQPKPLELCCTLFKLSKAHFAPCFFTLIGPAPEFDSFSYCYGLYQKFPEKKIIINNFHSCKF
jgi:hypothetical protein